MMRPPRFPGSLERPPLLSGGNPCAGKEWREVPPAIHGRIGDQQPVRSPSVRRSSRGSGTNSTHRALKVRARAEGAPLALEDRLENEVGGLDSPGARAAAEPDGVGSRAAHRTRGVVRGPEIVPLSLDG